MTLLEDYCESVRTSDGLRHARAVGALRDYIRDLGPAKLLVEIRRLKRAEHIRAMWEAGVNQEAQRSLLKVFDEIERKGKKGRFSWLGR